MLIVKIEMWPGGAEEEAQTVGIMQIVNDESGSYGKGNYDARILKWEKTDESWKEGRIDAFPRAKLGHWDLVYRALKSMIGYRNDEKRSRNYRAKK